MISSLKNFKESAIALYKKNPKAFVFLGRALLIYLVWTIGYRFFLQGLGINDPLTRIVAVCSTWLSQVFEGGLSMRYFGDRPYILRGSIGLVFIDDSCNGLRLYVLFVAFYLALNHFRQSIGWIFLGVIGIFVFNVLRVFGLTMLAIYQPEYLDFNHKYTFVVLVYSWILWVWVRSLKGKSVL